MKIISPKTLIASILICVPIMIYIIINFDGFFSFCWLCLFGYLLFSGIYMSFSREAFDKYNKKAEKNRVISEKMFGRFAPLMPFIPVFILCLDAAAAYFVPGEQRLIILLAIFALIASLGIFIAEKYGAYAYWAEDYTSPVTSEKGKED